MAVPGSMVEMEKGIQEEEEDKRHVYFKLRLTSKPGEPFVFRELLRDDHRG
jgi:hypothetical protein